MRIAQDQANITAQMNIGSSSVSIERELDRLIQLVPDGAELSPLAGSFTKETHFLQTFGI